MIVSEGNDANDDFYNSWQSYLWSQSSSDMIHLFEKSNYKIQLKYKIGSGNKYHGFVIVHT